MLLAGVAIGAISGAGIGYLVFLADDNQLRDLTFWGMGSLGGTDWSRLLIAGPPMLAAVVLLCRWGRELNALVLGETAASHLGVSVEVLKRRLIVLVALGVGCAVAVSGGIGFVGLVIPHLLRLLLGPDHRILLPASALGGAALLLFADLLARTMASPAEMPIGVITATLGGPFFLALLIRSTRPGRLL
jgi:iron complex transport system permease protein